MAKSERRQEARDRQAFQQVGAAEQEHKARAQDHARQGLAPLHKSEKTAGSLLGAGKIPGADHALRSIHHKFPAIVAAQA